MYVISYHVWDEHWNEVWLTHFFPTSHDELCNTLKWLIDAPPRLVIGEGKLDPLLKVSWTVEASSTNGGK